MKVTGQAALDEVFLMSERGGIEESEGRTWQLSGARSQ